MSTTETVRVYHQLIGYIDIIPQKDVSHRLGLMCPACRDIPLKWDGSRCECGHVFPNCPEMIAKCECGAGNNAPGHSDWCPKGN